MPIKNLRDQRTAVDEDEAVFELLAKLVGASRGAEATGLLEPDKVALGDGVEVSTTDLVGCDDVVGGEAEGGPFSAALFTDWAIEDLSGANSSTDFGSGRRSSRNSFLPANQSDPD